MKPAASGKCDPAGSWKEKVAGRLGGVSGDDRKTGGDSLKMDCAKSPATSSSEEWMEDADDGARMTEGIGIPPDMTAGGAGAVPESIAAVNDGEADEPASCRRDTWPSAARPSMNRRCRAARSAAEGSSGGARSSSSRASAWAAGGALWSHSPRRRTKPDAASSRAVIPPRSNARRARASRA